MKYSKGKMIEYDARASEGEKQETKGEKRVAEGENKGIGMGD